MFKKKWIHSFGGPHNADVGRHSRAFPVRFLEFGPPNRFGSRAQDGEPREQATKDPCGRKKGRLVFSYSPSPFFFFRSDPAPSSVIARLAVHTRSTTKFKRGTCTSPDHDAGNRAWWPVAINRASQTSLHLLSELRRHDRWFKVYYSVPRVTAHHAPMAPMAPSKPEGRVA